MTKPTTARQKLVAHLVTQHGEHSHIRGTHQQLALHHKADHDHQHMTH
jgi:hypothetical protein